MPTPEHKPHIVYGTPGDTSGRGAAPSGQSQRVGQSKDAGGAKLPRRTPNQHSMSPRDALLLIANEIEAGRETQLSPEKIRAVAEGATTRQGTSEAVLVGSAASGASPQHEVGDALIEAIVLGIDCDHQGCTDRTEAHTALTRLEEQLEASQRRVAQLELDVDRLSRAFDTGNA